MASSDKNNVKAPRDKYLDPYRRSLADNGTAFEVTLWASENSQRNRFDIFTKMMDFSGKRIVDAGCSRGDFAAFLLERSIDFESYTGVDALGEVVGFANTRGLARCRFIAADFLAKPDAMSTGSPHIVAISGSLNTMNEAQVDAVLTAAWRAASQALIFNFLSDRVGPEAPIQDEFTRRFDTMKMLKWAFDRTPVVQFRQDYFRAGHDATILMKKGK
jgi:hypothetical protein